jgi:hypothetical protein
MKVPTPSSLWSPRGIALSDSEKTEDLADTLETQISAGGRSFGLDSY